MNLHLLFHRICKILHYRHYYENEYGIKVHNKAPFYLSNSLDNIIEIMPNEVRLGFDALKDEYTLCGIKIQDSPHFDLVRRINNGEDILECDYVQREKKGTLDGRYEIRPCNHVDIFLKNKEQILNDNYQMPIVYYLDNNMYVFDGKHRLAMCCLFNLSCRCKIIEVDELKKDDNTIRLYKEMRGNDRYSINNKLLLSIFDSNM